MPSELITCAGQHSAESAEVNGSSEESVGEVTADANDDHSTDKESSKIASSPATSHTKVKTLSIVPEVRLLNIHNPQHAHKMGN